MQTTDLMAWLLSALGGVALGLFFFGGLWWTVRAIVDSPRAGLLQFASLWLRMVGVLGGFDVIGGGNVERLIACLAGFVLARVLVARCVRTSVLPSPSPGDPT